MVILANVEHTGVLKKGHISPMMVLNMDNTKTQETEGEFNPYEGLSNEAYYALKMAEQPWLLDDDEL